MSPVLGHKFIMSQMRRVWTEALNVAAPKLQKHILQLGPVDVILAICEIALNIISGNLSINSTKRQKGFLHQLADRSVSIKRKRVFLLKATGLRLLAHLLKARPQYESGQTDDVSG